MTTNPESLDHENEQTIIQTSGQTTALQTTDTLPALNVQGLMQFRNDLEYIIKNLMKKGIHYDKIKENFFMLKPGLDLLCTTASLLDIYEDAVIIDEGGNHRTYKYNCKLVRMKDRFIVAEATGEASTMETKFRYRNIYQNNNWIGKEELPPEMVLDKHYMVVQIAKTRAKRNAVNAFFSPAGFFADEPKPEKQQPQKQQEKSKQSPSNNKPKWDPTPQEKNDPNWFVTEINKLKSRDEIVEFHDVFELDEAFFGDADKQKIRDAYAERYKEVK